ncbi:MAG: hypothetical protein A3B66_07140 [Alphaproteobacteria bacterium RIFCSPHIGHO2_02_FULL_46_13]|nr:MAG: hypothetical protein A3B66_07140 [Alphaproteobacteria bacterium RIFCSPHIGHO2_02_FULL_46_13]
MKTFLSLALLVVLSGCVTQQDSPTKNMTEEQISHLADERLCDLQANSNFEPKLEVEIGKRDIECTKEFLSCKRQGYTPKTPAFENCKNFESVKSTATNIIDDVIRNTRYK